MEMPAEEMSAVVRVPAEEVPAVVRVPELELLIGELALDVVARSWAEERAGGVPVAVTTAPVELARLLEDTEVGNVGREPRWW